MVDAVFWPNFGVLVLYNSFGSEVYRVVLTGVAFFVAVGGPLFGRARSGSILRLAGDSILDSSLPQLTATVLRTGRGEYLCPQINTGPLRAFFFVRLDRVVRLGRILSYMYRC